MTTKVQPEDTTVSPEDLQMQMATETNTEKVLRDMVPQSDMDALRSIKDKEISAIRKQREQLETRIAELENKLGTEVDRRQHAETVASESQAEVNLRNFARQLAQSKYGVWGSDVQKAAEEKFLAAENRQHLFALEHEFASADLPHLVRDTEKGSQQEERRQKTLDTTVGLTSARIPATPVTQSPKGLDKVEGYIEKARLHYVWQSSDEGKAALREVKQVLAGFNYPVNQIRSWAQVANAIDTIKRYGGVSTGVKRTTQI